MRRPLSRPFYVVPQKRLRITLTEKGRAARRTPITNTPPSAPTGLALTATTNAVMLSWNSATNSQTPASDGQRAVAPQSPAHRPDEWPDGVLERAGRGHVLRRWPLRHRDEHRFHSATHHHAHLQHQRHRLVGTADLRLVSATNREPEHFELNPHAEWQCESRDLARHQRGAVLSLGESVNLIIRCAHRVAPFSKGSSSLTTTRSSTGIALHCSPTARSVKV